MKENVIVTSALLPANQLGNLQNGMGAGLQGHEFAAILDQHVSSASPAAATGEALPHGWSNGGQNLPPEMVDEAQAGPLHSLDLSLEHAQSQLDPTHMLPVTSDEESLTTDTRIATDLPNTFVSEEGALTLSQLSEAMTYGTGADSSMAPQGANPQQGNPERVAGEHDLTLTPPQTNTSNADSANYRSATTELPPNQSQDLSIGRAPDVLDNNSARLGSSFTSDEASTVIPTRNAEATQSAQATAATISNPLPATGQQTSDTSPPLATSAANTATPAQAPQADLQSSTRTPEGLAGSNTDSHLPNDAHTLNRQATDTLQVAQSQASIADKAPVATTATTAIAANNMTGDRAARATSGIKSDTPITAAGQPTVLGGDSRLNNQPNIAPTNTVHMEADADLLTSQTTMNKPAAELATADGQTVTQFSQYKGADADTAVPTSSLPSHLDPAADKNTQHLKMSGQASFNTPEWSQELGDKMIRLGQQNGTRFAEIQLDPPELGSLQVKVQVNQDSVSLTFTSPHANVREALEQSLPRLREMFDGQGLNLADASVADEKQHTNQGQGRGDGHPSDRYGQTGDQDMDAKDGTQQNISVNLVDYYA